MILKNNTFHLSTFISLKGISLGKAMYLLLIVSIINLIFGCLLVWAKEIFPRRNKNWTDSQINLLGIVLIIVSIMNLISFFGRIPSYSHPPREKGFYLK